MNFEKFKESLKYRKYSSIKIFIRYFEYKIKNFAIDLIIKTNIFKPKSKPILDLGSFKDNRFINYLLFSLKNDFLFVYKEDNNTKKLFKRIGIINFFKHTASNSKFRKNIIKLYINKKNLESDEISFDTDYFNGIENGKKKNSIVMPYYMYPRIYNSFYKKINIQEKPNFKLRVFFSGSIVKDGYENFFWKKNPKKFPNRISVIEKILNEFKNEIFLIKNRNDFKSPEISKKKIVLCLHDKMIKKTSYNLSFKKNLEFLGNSCFNISCPGVVMPLCHHLIEGMKVGSIPITNCEKMLYPNLTSNISLHYSNLDQLISQIENALVMDEDEIMFMRKKVFKHYRDFLSPESFKINFFNVLKKKEKRIICNDDHRSIDNFSLI